MIPTKLTGVSPVLFALRLVTAMYFAIALTLSCCLSLPARAEETSTRDNWKIAKANVDKFLAMNDKAIADLFGHKRDNKFGCRIEIDDNTTLQIYKTEPSPYLLPMKFSFQSMNIRPKTLPSWMTHCGTGATYDSSFDQGPDTVWSGAKRKEEKEYWKIIKANLDKFIGMSGEEVIKLLGTERCSSKSNNFIQYRIGDAGLTFYLCEDKVQIFSFKSDTYIPGT